MIHVDRDRLARLAPVLAVLAALLLAMVADAAPAFRRTKNRRLRFLAGPIQPWDLSGAPRPFEEVCFQDRSSLGGLTDKEARRWLEPVKNQALEIVQQGTDVTRFVRFRGMGKLHEWAPDAVLRLSFAGTSFRIHFWNGQEGVSLYSYHDRGRQWAAYRRTWQPGEPQPAQPGGPAALALLTTDDHRAKRFDDDTFEVRWQDGLVVLTKGDVRLMTVPLAGQPTAVYIESQQGVMLRDLAVCRSGPAPDDTTWPHRVVLGGQPLAAMSWKENTTGSNHLQRLADGRIELTAGKTTAPVWATVAAPPAGPCEVIFELENFTAGAGVFLADGEGRPLEGVEFARDQHTGWTSFHFGKPGTPLWGAAANPEGTPATYAPSKVWLRLVSAAGVFKCWTSGDGVHWGQILTTNPQAGRWREVGIYIQTSRHEQPGGMDSVRRIQLRSLQIRQLDGLANLVPAELREQVAALEPGGGQNRYLNDRESWLRWVRESRPGGADEPSWRIACSVVTLAANPNQDVARMVFDELLTDGLERATTLDARLDLLQDAAILLDGRNTEDDLRYAEHWEQVGRTLLADGTLADFDLLRRAFAAASLATQDQRIEPLDWKLSRDRLLVLLGQLQWRQLYEWCSRLMFWHQGLEGRTVWPPEQQSLQRLVDWTLGELGGVRAGQDGHTTVAAETGTQHALSVSIDREAYNAVSDLQTACDDRLFGDAAQVLSATAPVRGDGLIPDAKDVQLFTSYAAAVRLAADRYPQLQEEIASRFKAADELRVRAAMTRNDVTAIEGFVLQYYGTPAAAAAHRWLGDRLLSGGKFAPALIHYQEALPSASPEQRQTLNARIRLTAAMLGRKLGEPVRRPLAFGESTVQPASFEQWIGEMLDRHRAAPEGLKLWPRIGPLASPQGLDAKLAGKLKGDVGNEPNSVPWPTAQTDWLARQTAMTPAGNRLLVANRFQVTALDLGTGKSAWTYSLGSNQGQTHALSLVPMRPVVAGDRVYARMLPRSGHPMLACLDLETGRKLWDRESPIDLVSDPLPVDDRLFILAVDMSAAQFGTPLVLLELDRESGEAISRRALFDLRGLGGVAPVCQAAVAHDRIVAAVGGIVFCLDSERQIGWLRSTPCIPASLDLFTGQQYPQTPWVSGDRVYVTQPGVPNIECVDLETGRLAWRRGIAGLRRILDVDDDRLVVETIGCIQAFRTAAGESLWRREIPQMLDGFVRPGPGLLLCAQRKTLDGGSHCPVLVWIDLATGETKARSPLPNLRGKQPQLGPMVIFDNRLWSLANHADSEGHPTPQHSLIELVPAG